jgi:WhiB family transcriptional regulator, redox-sensing transcriptional regulator
VRRIAAFTVEPDTAGPADPGCWADALCRSADPNVFFSDDTTTAVAICQRCPVIEPCGDYAVRERLDHGVWGGLTGVQRRAIAKERGIAWAPVSDPPARRECAANCGRWARPSRRLCSACAQREYRLARR